MFPELLARCSTPTPALSAAQLAALEGHYELLCRWNRSLNLTTVLEVEAAVERHYCEGLFLAMRLDGGGSVADIGSGAGFPGFVVAVARPECAVTLIESHQRKAVFLREVSRRISNVRVVSKRAEEVQERFDWVVSRAVSYEDLGKSVLRLASRVALLTGVDEPPEDWGLEWEVVPLPWGRQRFLRIGRVVSRETA